MAPSAPPYWSFAGVVEGARLTLPLVPGTAFFGLVVGTLAAQKGLTLFEAVLMSGIVFAGASQLVALEAWPDTWTLASVASVALVTGTVNLRFFLMSASLRPWFGPLPAWQSYAALSCLTDAPWLVGMRYQAGGGSDVGVFVGSGMSLWFIWVLFTFPGYLMGAIMDEPQRYGFDLVMPVFFVTMLVPLWRGARRAAPWLVAGLAGVAAAQVVPGWWFIIVGALAGSIAAGLFGDERADA
jgi:predicted branched-subunit amino acid permease